MYLRNNHENRVSVSALVKFKHHIKLDWIQVPLFAVAAFAVPGCVEVALFPKFSTFTSRAWKRHSARYRIVKLLVTLVGSKPEIAYVPTFALSGTIVTNKPSLVWIVVQSFVLNDLRSPVIINPTCVRRQVPHRPPRGFLGLPSKPRHWCLW